MEFQELIEKRYSCRKFSDRKVDPALADQIVEAGRLAPTAVNQQPIQIFRMESEQAKAAVRQVTTCTFGADTFLIVGCRNQEGWTRPFDGRSFADVDGAIAATHMLLKITDLGLATTWVGYFDAPRLKQLCPALADWDLIALFPVGYAAEDAQPSPRHLERRPADRLTRTL